MIDEDLNKKVCEFNKYMRVRYFHGMLLDDKDFTTEQQYHIGKRKLLNRMLHGWGVVCGLDIEWEKGKKWLKIMPGMAMDCHGNEILVCDPVTIDLTKTACFETTAAPEGQMTAEDCKQQEQTGQLKVCYIGICYDEKSAAPVPVYIPGEECEKRECDHSRWKEGFCIDILKSCPEQYPSAPGIITQLLGCEPEDGKNGQSTQQTDAKKDPEVIACQDKFLEEYCKKPPPCPECCTEKQYVGLGKIVLNPKREIEEVIINECRRYVISGNLIRYLISSTLTGLNNRYQLLKDGQPVGPIPDPNILHGNPLHALCWLLKHILIHGNEIGEKDKKKKVSEKEVVAGIVAIKQEVDDKHQYYEKQVQDLHEQCQFLREALKKTTSWQDMKKRINKQYPSE